MSHGFKAIFDGKPIKAVAKSRKSGISCPIVAEFQNRGSALSLGSGTQAEPFTALVRHVVNTLITKPRMNLETIKARLAGQQGIGSLKKEIFDTGFLSSFMTFRVHLKMTRADIAPSTFVDVTLVKQDSQMQAQFEIAIRSVNGVIEWDAVKGHERDYLVRIINRGNIFLIRDRISALDCVKSAVMSDIEIINSGVVDNFTADDFFAIQPDKVRKQKPRQSAQSQQPEQPEQPDQPTEA